VRSRAEGMPGPPSVRVPGPAPESQSRSAALRTSAGVSASHRWRIEVAARPPRPTRSRSGASPSVPRSRIGSAGSIARSWRASRSESRRICGKRPSRQQADGSWSADRSRRGPPRPRRASPRAPSHPDLPPGRGCAACPGAIRWQNVRDAAQGASVADDGRAVDAERFETGAAPDLRRVPVELRHAVGRVPDGARFRVHDRVRPREHAVAPVVERRDLHHAEAERLQLLSDPLVGFEVAPGAFSGDPIPARVSSSSCPASSRASSQARPSRGLPRTAMPSPARLKNMSRWSWGIASGSPRSATGRSKRSCRRSSTSPGDASRFSARTEAPTSTRLSLTSAFPPSSRRVRRLICLQVAQESARPVSAS
jgi:hypothetical protein